MHFTTKSTKGSAGTLNAGARSETLLMGNDWIAIEKRVEQGIKVQGRYFVSAPAEMEQLGDVESAHAFAKWHGWMFVNHLEGTNYEFFETRTGQQLY